MQANQELPLRQRLHHWIEHLTHILPAQAPIRDFVHHNTLHGFQHLPFAQALAAAQQLTGARPYWPEDRFLAEYSAGRITSADLCGALDDVGLADLAADVVPGLTRRELLLAALLIGSPTSRQAHSASFINERVTPLERLFPRCSQLTAEMPSPPTDWRELALERWQMLCAEVGVSCTLRRLLEYLSGEDVLETVRAILQRHLAAHLDLGFAAWRNPACSNGFFAAWKASAAVDLAWELDELPGVRDEIHDLPDDPLLVLETELCSLLPDEALWPGYLERLALELPGWSGMFLWRDRHPDFTAPSAESAPVDMVDYFAVRIFLERHLCTELIRRLTGAPLAFTDLQAYYQGQPAEFLVRYAVHSASLPEDLQAAAAGLCAASADGREVSGWAALAPSLASHLQADQAAALAWQLARLAEQLGWGDAELRALDVAGAGRLLAAVDALAPLRSQVWLAAYEAHYREQLFVALTANARHVHHWPQPSAQVVMCMDDREEGTRRHLEEVAPDIQTFGAAGFFGVAMYWQGVDDAVRSALCPVVVTPEHAVREMPRPGHEAAQAQRARRRETRLRWRERLYQGTRRQALAGPLLTALAGAPALLTLTVASLAPGWLADTGRRWRQQFEGRLRTALAESAVVAEGAVAGAVQEGFSDVEQVDRVEGFLRTIGLTEGFAPLVLILGHGSGSRNNPHLSAYDCGACSGRHGGPNARVFAAMANRRTVREQLIGRAIEIPDSCYFVAAEHHTGDDSIEWYDLDQVPDAWQEKLDILLAQLAEACRLHAVERCRRLASAPPRPTPWQAKQHVADRVADLAQARPELGHATNAAAFIGRRSMSRGLFLDRRVFLISYDPANDPDGGIVERILLAAGPVGAGIALEYYFSTVDNERFGCGSKVTHNLTGLFGVMEGADSDLRTGLPWQMVEIHEPMRLLVVVEQTPAQLTQILGRQPALQELVGNGWINLAAQDPSTAALSRYCPRRGWLAWSGEAVLPQVAKSLDWFAGESGPLAPALLRGALA
jgi:uncharacterized protein YbcC (UPF0753/DUF2309 family)